MEVSMAYIDIDMTRCKVRPSAKPTHPSFEDLTRRDFDAWRVVGFYGQTVRYESVWVCECSCGRLAFVLAKNLKRSGSRRCRHCAAHASMKRRWEQKFAAGFRPKERVRRVRCRRQRARIIPGPKPTHRRFKDLTGREINDWLIHGYLGINAKSHQNVWVCECRCGGIHEVLQGNLKQGGSKRCRTCGNKRVAPRGSDGRFLGKPQHEPDPETIRRLCAEIRERKAREGLHRDV